jgi:hypothetical protein
MTAIAAAGLIVAAMSVTSLSILVFAQQEQKPQQQQKVVAQDSSSTYPIIMNQFSSTANSLPNVFARVLIPVYFATGDISMIINMYICLYVFVI